LAENPVESLASSALALSMVEAGLQMDIAVVYDAERMTESQRQGLAAQGEAVTDDLFPANTILYLVGHRLDLLWANIRDGMIAEGGESAFADQMLSFENQFGIDPNADLFPLLDGEYALGILPDVGGPLAEQTEVPLGLAFLAGSSRPDALKSTAEAFSQQLQEQGTSISRSEAGDTVTYAVSLGGENTAPLLFGVSGDGYLFISTAQTTVDTLFGGGNHLGDSDRYQDVWREFPAGANPVFFLDLDGLTGTVREGLSGSQLDSFDEAVRFVDPFTFLAVGADAGDNTLKVTTILFVEEEAGQD
jgi:hypothetical protein